MTEPTLQQLVERFREVRGKGNYYATANAAMAMANHIAEHGLPSWQDRMTCNGRWVTEADRLLIINNIEQMAWVPNYGRVFGPLPPDTQRRDGE